MTEQLLFALAGAAGALVFAMVVRAVAREPERRYAVALLVAALLYVLFAALGQSASGLAVEAAGVVAFGGLALLGLRRRAPLLVAAAWALHPVWDVALHTAGAGAAYTPRGYMAACIGFDLVLAALIVRSSLLSTRSVTKTRRSQQVAEAK
ncbi:MAG TPA: DUF6010 family protein [Longimicrobiales bacterium]|nr:DUF6010 family protein [Longimicrobiales bacterium]